MSIDKDVALYIKENLPTYGDDLDKFIDDSIIDSLDYGRACTMVKFCNETVGAFPTPKVKDASLLSLEAARSLDEKYLKFIGGWWIKDFDEIEDLPYSVTEKGHISRGLYFPAAELYVRPALDITDGYPGSFFIFKDKLFLVLTTKLAFCLGHIKWSPYSAKNGNTYEDSDICKFIQEWFRSK